jgi:hypothetical protein
MRQHSQHRHASNHSISACILMLCSTPLMGSIVFLETFETDGEGITYTSTGSFTDGIDDYFIRTDGSTEATGIPTYTGFGGSYFWAAEDIDATENTTGLALLEFSGISIAEIPFIEISLDIGAGSDSAFDSLDDFIFVQYRVDAGAWTTAIAFQNNGQVYNGPLLKDTDFDGIGDGTFLTLDLQTVSSPELSVSGTVLDLRIDTLMTSGSEAVAFDNIQVIAVPEPRTTALLISLAASLTILRKRFLPQREDKSRA